MTDSANASIATTGSIESWFSALGSHARRALFAVPRGEVPQKYVDEVLTKGYKLALPWFSESVASEPFRLPEVVADYVDDILAELQGWWVGLSNERRLQWAGVGHAPVPARLHISYPRLFEFVPGDDAVYADPQVLDFIAIAAA